MPCLVSSPSGLQYKPWTYKIAPAQLYSGLPDSELIVSRLAILFSPLHSRVPCFFPVSLPPLPSLPFFGCRLSPPVPPLLLSYHTIARGSPSTLLPPLVRPCAADSHSQRKASRHIRFDTRPSLARLVLGLALLPLSLRQRPACPSVRAGTPESAKLHFPPCANIIPSLRRPAKTSDSPPTAHRPGSSFALSAPADLVVAPLSLANLWSSFLFPFYHFQATKLSSQYIHRLLSVLRLFIATSLTLGPHAAKDALAVTPSISRSDPSIESSSLLL